MNRVREQDRLLSAIERLPVVQAAKEHASATRVEQRTQWLRAIEIAGRKLKRTEFDLSAKARPIEDRLTKLRAEIAELEAELNPMARTRLSAMWDCESDIADLRAQLSSDAVECSELLRAISQTRNNLNDASTRGSILDSMAPPNSRVVEALAILLTAYNDVRNAAMEEADISAALEAIKARISAKGIRLVTV